MNKVLILSMVGVAAFSSVADEVQRETFGKWHVGVGAAFNAGVRSRLGCRNLPTPRGYAIPVALSYEKAAADSAAHRWLDGAAFIADDGGYEDETENWRLPISDGFYDRGTSTFTLDNPYEVVAGGPVDDAYHDGSDKEMQYGVSIELSRELWIHDEQDEHRWGVDFAASFSYFFKRDVYSACGTVTRADEVRERYLRTTVTDPAAMFDYNAGIDLPVDGMYGYGTGVGYERTGLNPSLGWDSIGNPVDGAGPTRSVVSSYGYLANGDYRELEMLFMLRPWYEITDWWRITAEVGVGVSWGRFDASFSGDGISAREKFAQWDCYGVAGLGTAFRYDEWTLGIDFLGRFWRDDLDVDGRYVSGSIERSDWGFRVMLGYEF